MLSQTVLVSSLALSTLLVSAGSIGVGVSSRAALSAAVDINNTDAAYRKLYVRSGTTPHLLVDADGQVGIGCNAPQYALDVVGQMNITSNIITPYIKQTSAKVFSYTTSTGDILGVLNNIPTYTNFSLNLLGNYPMITAGGNTSAYFKVPETGLYCITLSGNSYILLNTYGYFLSVYMTDSSYNLGPLIMTLNNQVNSTGIGGTIMYTAASRTIYTQLAVNSNITVLGQFDGAAGDSGLLSGILTIQYIG